jgi:L-arabinose transport system substrate-binding protein
MLLRNVRTRIGFILLAVVLTAGLTSAGLTSAGLGAGCRGGAPRERLLFALLVNRLNNPWTEQQIAGFREACGRLDADVLVLDNQMDANMTLSNLDVALEQGADGVALSPPDQKISALIVDRAFSADIPVVALDLRLLDYNNRQLAPYLGVPNSKAGHASGQWLASEIERLGWLEDRSLTVGVAALTFDPIWDMRLRTDACRQALLDNSPALSPEQIYPVHHRRMDAVGALMGMHELISTHPEVTNWVVYAGNDEGVTGAVRALEQVGLDAKALGCGIGYGRARTELEGPRRTAFKATVFLDGAEIGRTAAEYLYNYRVNGIPIPATTYTDAQVTEAAP